MAQAELKKEVAVSADSFFKAVTAYSSYPKAVEGCTGAEMTKPKDASGLSEVKYTVSMIKDLTYVLKHEENPEKRTMSWSLVSSEFLKKNSGSWTVTEKGPDRAEVSYKIEIEFNFPVPGFVVKKLIQTQLPKMFAQFEGLAEKL